jgi:DMSO reductase anchor subunit
MGVYFERSLAAATWSVVQPVHSASTAAWGMLALIASTFHLGRPQFAFRAVLGLGHSWLSREIVCFALFLFLAALHTAAVVTGQERARQVLTDLACLSGIITVICSVMIYAVTRRQLWTPMRTGIRFFLSMGLLGAVAVWLAAAVATYTQLSAAQISPLSAVTPVCARIVPCVMATKLLYELALVRHLCSRRMTSLKRSALLYTRQLARITTLRFALGTVGGLVLPAWLGNAPWISGNQVPSGAVGGVLILAAACIAGELFERLLFFRSVASARMPGAIQ